MTYRVGRHQPQNLYRDDAYIGVMFDAEDAALVVAALNGWIEPSVEPPIEHRVAAEPGPFGPTIDPCAGCGCAKAWHDNGRCTGDFLCCPCETWMPLEAQP